MVRIAICDDMKDVSLGIKKIICRHDFLTKMQVDCFTSGQDLFANFIKHHYDLILLDIELSDNENGMYISNKIKDLYSDVIIIFFTGQVGYETELLNFEPFRFLSKPIKESDLVAAVDDAIKRLSGWEDKYFTFTINGISFRINLKEIVYFVSQSPYINIKCIDDQIKLRGKMDSIEHKLGKISNEFVRTSKSYLVNTAFIKSYTSKEIILSDGEKISLTRKYTKQFIKKMNNS